MKTYRQREKQGNKVPESTKGPDEAKIKVISRYVELSALFLTREHINGLLNLCVGIFTVKRIFVFFS